MLKLRKTKLEKSKSFENGFGVCNRRRKVVDTETARKVEVVMKLNKKKFFKFLFVSSMMVMCAVLDNGNITGALILAMLI